MADLPEKFDLKSQDITEDKRQELLRLFPEIRTEGDQIDFDRLKLALGEAVDVGKERYGMTWPGKSDCRKTIEAPSLGTLRPCQEESVNFDTTENLIIEGDNLEVLKLLQKSYLGKVKIIYIDPPYNTGNDFIYPDKYSESLQTYLEYTGQVDAEGRRFGNNTEADGRFHSKWINMMYPRLYLAKNLLRDDGLIFISIDNMESDNLRKICNEIYGEDNFRKEGIIRRGAKSVQAQFETWDKLGIGYEKILIYSKTSDYRFPKQTRLLEEAKTGTWNNHWRGTDRPTMRYELFGITPDTGQWRWGKDRSLQAIKNYQNMLGELGRNEPTITQEQIDEYYMQSVENGEDIDFLRLSSNGKPEHYVPPTESTLLNDVWFDLPISSSKEVRILFDGKKVYDNPKPSSLIRRALDFGEKADIILDFFAGSGTTAHAVLDLNKQDGGNRKFILVQLPEPLDPNNKDQKTAADICDSLGKPRTIAEITKERVRRVINNLDDENTGKLELDDASKQYLGFRVFKLAESNFKLWNAEVPHDAQALERQLELHVDHIREGRTADDILYEILLKSWTVALTTPIERLALAGKTVYRISGGLFFICLERELTLELIRAMAEQKPERVVCLDEGFAGNDQLKANAVQIFKTKGITSFKTV
ncbi:MAG: site-specific DNA-methyltransferase [Desulfobaccales bacterium]